MKPSRKRCRARTIRGNGVLLKIEGSKVNTAAEQPKP